MFGGGRRRRRAPALPRPGSAGKRRGGPFLPTRPPPPPFSLSLSLSLSLSSRLHSGASGEGRPTLVFMCINQRFHLFQLNGLPPHTYMPPAHARQGHHPDRARHEQHHPARPCPPCPPTRPPPPRRRPPRPWPAQGRGRASAGRASVPKRVSPIGLA